MLALLLNTVASAQTPPVCPAHPDDVEAAARRSAAAVAEDDAAGHTAAFDEILARLPCLDGALPRTAWVRLLVDEAIVRSAAGQPYQDPLAAALAADPTAAVPDFLSTADLPADRSPTPGSLRFPTTVDGASLDAPVALWGLHVVQAHTPELRTWVIRDGELPKELVEPPPAPPPPTVAPRWLTAGLGGGWIDEEQVVERPGDQLRDALLRGPVASASVAGRIALAGPLAAVARVSAQLGEELLPSAELGAGLRAGPVTVWIGGAAVGMGVVEPAGRRLALLPQPALGALVVSSGERPLDLAVSGGYTPSLWNVQARWGVGVARLADDLTLRLGTEVAAASGRFVQDAPGARAARIVTGSGGLQLGIGAGR